MNRKMMERTIIRMALEEMVAGGCEIQLRSGNALVTLRTTDVEAVMQKLMAADEEYLWVWYHAENDWEYSGMISFIYGKNGWDVIKNDLPDLKPFLKRTSEFSDRLSKVI